MCAGRWQGRIEKSQCPPRHMTSSSIVAHVLQSSIHELEETARIGRSPL